MESSILSNVLELVLVLGLIGANAFFVAAEFALVRVRRTRIEELVSQGSDAARWVQRAIRNLDRSIAATQLGITMAGLALGWVAEPGLSALTQPLVRLFPLELSDAVSRSASAALAFALITFLTVVIGELAPKSIALRHSERAALFVARPIVVWSSLFRPAVWALTGSANRLLRLFGIKPAAGREVVHSVQELKMLVSASAAGGVVEADEQDMLDAVFDLGETLVRQVMIPRTEMIAIPAEASLEEIIAVALRHPFTRFPVYEGSLDQIVGVVHLRDVMRARHSAPPETATARGLMRRALFVPETVDAISLLRRFRARRQRLAIVLDEYGGTAGLVTLEDLLEEIVGEVSDEFDEDQSIRPLPDGSWVIAGLTPIVEVNEHFDLQLHDPHYDTIAGFVLGRLGRLARVGDTVEGEGVRLRVEALDGRRIARVSLFRLPHSG
ncbi:MAG: hemolysin family protein [Chloroflexota bacterium]